MRLTHDQSFVQDMIDNGRLTEEEAETHPQRNILLRCVGAEKEVVPKYTNGSYREGDVFLLCSDGLRHKISEAEMFEALRPGKNTTEEELRDALEKMVQTAMEREELDNITAVAVIASIGE
jgi:serine/threonine protein phosphatase PrpC